MRILDNINFGIYNYFKYAITDNSDEKEETVLAKTHKDIVDGICYLLCKCEEQYRKINNLPQALPKDKPYILSNNVIKKVQYAYSFKLNFETIIKGI